MKFSWQGFQLDPTGHLLKQVVDLTGSMGLAYERSIDFYKDFHHHDRLMLVFPRGSCRMRVESPNKNFSGLIDKSTVAIIPSGFKHNDQSVSAVYDTLALYPSDDLLQNTFRILNIGAKRAESILRTPQILKRSPWLNELVLEYFFDRLVKKSNDEDLVFFEKRIMQEIIKISENRFDKTKPEETSESLTINRAIAFIEANLFDSMDLDVIARGCNVSVSTLVRNFKTKLGITPYSYIKNRRLDEAAALIKSGNYNVGQVALLVGYENFGAFTDAFKSKFKFTPSEIKK